MAVHPASDCKHEELESVGHSLRLRGNRAQRRPCRSDLLTSADLSHHTTSGLTAKQNSCETASRLMPPRSRRRWRQQSELPPSHVGCASLHRRPELVRGTAAAPSSEKGQSSRKPGPSDNNGSRRRVRGQSRPTGMRSVRQSRSWYERRAGLRGDVVVCFTRGHCRPRPLGRTIDDGKPELGPAAWWRLSAIRRVGAGSGVRSAATIPYHRHQVPERLVQVIVDLGGSLPLTHNDADHALQGSKSHTSRSVNGCVCGGLHRFTVVACHQRELLPTLGFDPPADGPDFRPHAKRLAVFASP